MSAAVRAKFKVQSITQQGGSVSTVRVNLTPVVSGSPENEQFFSATPGGQIDLQVVNPDAGQAFEVDKEYYVDFTPATPDAVAVA